MYDQDKFDRMIKSTMECGEEEVPDGLWEEIASRLDAEEAAAAGVFFRKRRTRRVLSVLSGLAAACVLTLLLLRPSAMPETTPDNVTGHYIGLADAMGESAACESIPDAAMRSEDVATPPAAAPIAEATVEVPVEIPAEASVEVPMEESAEALTGTVGGNAAAAATGIAAATPSTPSTPSGFQTNAEDILFPDDGNNPAGRRVAIALTANANSGGDIGTSLYSVGFRTADIQRFGKEKIIETESTSFAPPVSVGIGLRFALNRHWAIGTGLIYNYLGRRYNGTYEYAGALDSESIKGIWNSQHYIGIPLDVYYTFAGTEKMDFYIMAGGTAEKCVAETHRFAYYGHNMVFRNSVAGIQFSAGLGLGMQYYFSDIVGFYIEPSFRYFFKEPHQSRSIRTMQPFEIGCELGFRFNLPR